MAPVSKIQEVVKLLDPIISQHRKLLSTSQAALQISLTKMEQLEYAELNCRFAAAAAACKLPANVTLPSKCGVPGWGLRSVGCRLLSTEVDIVSPQLEKASEVTAGLLVKSTAAQRDMDELVASCKAYTTELEEMQDEQRRVRCPRPFILTLKSDWRGFVTASGL